MDSNCTMNYNTGSEQGDSSSAEEVESPRSVVTAASGRRNGRPRLRRWRKTDRLNIRKNEAIQQKEKFYLHNQVLRIKEEELRIGEYLMSDFGIFSINYVPNYPLNDVLSTTCILPASPLGSNKNS